MKLSDNQTLLFQPETKLPTKPSLANMNAAEIKTRIADLEKASKDNLPADRFIDILNSLRKEIRITEQLLRVGHRQGIIDYHDYLDCMES